MKHHLIEAAFVSLIIGMLLLLFSSVRTYRNEKEQCEAVCDYISAVKRIPDEDILKILKDAEIFNSKIAGGAAMPMYLPDSLAAGYYSALDIMGNGMIGYINVSKAGILIPFYHSTDEDVLKSGAGHIVGTSFPIDGDAVHAVILGHRALSYTRMFANLGKVKTDDTFTVYILNKAYTYKVYGVETVLPSDTGSLFIKDGKNRCSLVTCTPFGSESHRLLIHGEHIATASSEEMPLPGSRQYFIRMCLAAIAVEMIILCAAVFFAVRHIISCYNEKADGVSDEV